MGRMLARHCLRAARNRQKLRPMAVFRQPFRRTGQQFLYPSRTLHRPENPLRRRRSSEILAQTRTAKPTAARLGVRTSRPVRPLADFRRTPAPRRRAYRRATAAPDYHPSYHRPTQPPNRHRTRNRKNRRPVAIRKNRLTNRPQSPSLKRRQPTHRPSFRYPPPTCCTPPAPPPTPPRKPGCNNYKPTLRNTVLPKNLHAFGQRNHGR